VNLHICSNKYNTKQSINAYIGCRKRDVIRCRRLKAQKGQKGVARTLYIAFANVWPCREWQRGDLLPLYRLILWTEISVMQGQASGSSSAARTVNVKYLPSFRVERDKQLLQLQSNRIQRTKSNWLQIFRWEEINTKEWEFQYFTRGSSKQSGLQDFFSASLYTFKSDKSPFDRAYDFRLRKCEKLPTSEFPF